MTAQPALRLVRLRIEDFGLIAQSEVDFSSGLTVFSGETGSGKTMILGGLALVLGERSTTVAARAGADRARLTLEFIPNATVIARCAACDIALDVDEDAVLIREIRDGGRSNFRLNGRALTGSQVREIFAGAVEIIGQHEQQRLVLPSEHALMLDRYAGSRAMELRATLEAAYLRVQTSKAELADVTTELHRREFEYQAAHEFVELYDSLAPAIDEDHALRERRDRLRHAQSITEALDIAHEALNADENSSNTRLGDALAALTPIERYGAEFAAIGHTLRTLQSELQEVAARLNGEAREHLELDAESMEKTLERLEELERLKRRYGGSLAEVADRAAAARAVLDQQRTRDDRLTAAKARLTDAQTELQRGSAELRELRAAAAGRLVPAIEAEFGELAMPNARFLVELEPLPEAGAHGSERVQFLLAANAGQAPAGLAHAASGGELSRILLALITVFAANSEIETFIFDEIDAGIGGTTALVVGERLARLSRNAQVICVTHLAQIAAHGRRHVVVHKASVDARSAVELQVLNSGEERVTEIARMLSGEKTTIARDHAAELLKRYQVL